jgi:hypothetical protein
MTKRKQQSQHSDVSKQRQETQKQKSSGQPPHREESSEQNRTRDFGGENPNDFERQKDKGYGQEPFDEQQFEEDSGSGSFNEGGAAGGHGHSGQQGSK